MPQLTTVRNGLTATVRSIDGSPWLAPGTIRWVGSLLKGPIRPAALKGVVCVEVDELTISWRLHPDLAASWADVIRRHTELSAAAARLIGARY